MSATDDGRVGHARDVDQAGHFGKHRRLPGEMMVERVVNQPEDLAGVDRADRVGRFLLGAQRANLEAERLDQPGDAA